MSRDLIRSPQNAVTGIRHSVPVYTLNEVPGRASTLVLGLALGDSPRTRHIGSGIIAFFRTLTGGQIPVCTPTMGQSREQAVDRIAQRARQIGGERRFGGRFTARVVMAGAAKNLV